MYPPPLIFLFFFFNDTATTEIYTLSLHDALPICRSSAAMVFFITMAVRRPSRLPAGRLRGSRLGSLRSARTHRARSEEHTSELQSHLNLVCRLLLEKKKKTNTIYSHLCANSTSFI